MTKQATAGQADPYSVRKVVTVQAPPLVAWRVFTGQMGSWWPLAHYKIGKTNAVDAIIEPNVGGRLVLNIRHPSEGIGRLAGRLSGSRRRSRSRRA